MAKKLLLFVCTSNTCRSPMAEQFAKEILRTQNNNEYEVKSRSITTDFEPEGSPASPEGVEVMKTLFNLDSSDHRSKLIDQADIANASKIICVTRSHAFYLTQRFPGAAPKTVTLERDVQDPWHQELEVYASCAKAMQPLVRQAMDKWVFNQ